MSAMDHAVPFMAAPARRRSGVTFSARIILVVLGLALTWDACGEFIHLVRVSLVQRIGLAYSALNALMLTLLVLAALRGFAMFATRRDVKVRGAQIALLGVAVFVLGQGLFMAAWNHASVNRPFIAHLYYWLTMFLGFGVGFSVLLNGEALGRLHVLIGRFSLIIVVVSAFGIVALESFRILFGADLYVGYPAEQLLLPLAHYGSRRRWFAVAVIIALIVLSGKRGPQLAAVMMLIYLVSRGRLLPSVILLVLAGIIVPLLPHAFRVIEERGWVSDESTLGRSLHKWTMTVELASENITVASSGRNLEISEALKNIQGPFDLFAGRGFGWSFFLEDDVEPTHFVHLAYLNLVITYGIIGSLLILTGVALVFLLMWRASLTPYAPLVLKEVTLFVYGFLLLTFTVNLLSVYLVFWILLGVGAQMATIDWRPQLIEHPA